MAQNKNKGEDLPSALLALLPADGSAVGNPKLREALGGKLGKAVTEAAYTAARDALVTAGLAAKGQGRGGSLRRIVAPRDELVLAAQAIQDDPKPRQARLTDAPRQPSGPRASGDDVQVLSYRHQDKRRTNPEVGLVSPETDPEQPRTTWAYDPHIDPALQFDVGRAEVETLIDDALASGDEQAMRAALKRLKSMSAPYLNWTGKAERTSFEVDTVSLHVHERIDPASILAAVRKRVRESKGGAGIAQPDLFAAPFENLPLRDAIDFYKHERGWANRLIAGDSLLVMNSLLQKESMAGQVQMIYIDPPYGIKYGSNFQPFVGKRDVKDRNDADLTQEPEMIKAFRDTWELGIHSYLTYLRDRLLLARELLSESGSVFVQISDENLHRVREVMDEVLGSESAMPMIVFRKTTGAGSPSGHVDELPQTCDFLVWYARNRASTKIRRLFLKKQFEDDLNFKSVQDDLGRRRTLRKGEALPPAGSALRLFRQNPMTSQSGGQTTQFPVSMRGALFEPGRGGWKTNADGVRRLQGSQRLISSGETLGFLRFSSDFDCQPVIDIWDDTRQSGFGDPKTYVVQTASKVVERCMLMVTDPGDLVLDPTCGSGTTAYVSEKLGRRWITCDTSRVAVTLAKQRLMTASYEYYDLKYPHEGLKSGFIYKAVPHVTLKSIANNPEIDEIHLRMYPAVVAALVDLNATLAKLPPATAFAVTDGGRKGLQLNLGKPGTHTLPTGDKVPAGALLEWEVPFDFPADWPHAARAPFDAFHAARQAMQKRMDASIAAHADQEILYDQPQVSKDKRRITGPFTVEAVPFPTVLSLDETAPAKEADVAIARSGESSRQHRWRDELVKTGIRGKGGQMLKFAELETLPGTRYLHCTGTVADTGERVVVAFGPEHAALEQRQVEMAMREAGELFPRPKMIVYCAFTFDPEAAKDIDQTRGITALKAQMNTDLLTEDLKKNRASNQSFWLMGQPDVDVRRRKDGRWEVEVNGFDYFDTAKGDLVSGGKAKIAMWLLDTDYDERSLFPRQVFFPMAGKDEGWFKLKRDVRAELNEELLPKFHGTVSLPFEAGDNRKVAVKIIDDRGIESLKIMLLDAE
jgi:adenine-specific DNA-methyltransferase